MNDTQKITPDSVSSAIGNEDVETALEPLKVSDFTLRNRVVLSPMSTNMAERDGSITDDMIKFYSGPGNGGVGMVTTGAMAVSWEGGDSANCPHIGTKALEPNLRRLAEAIKATGAVCSIQLFHVGAQGNTVYSGTPVVGPSSYVCPDIKIEALELDIGEIADIEDNFVTGILSGLDCGFDLVELHIAHGYLLHEFISPFFNRRDDKYGGSENNRLRIFENILEKTHKREPAALHRIGARISGDDFQPDGMNIPRNRPLVALFEGYGSAYWSISAGVYETARTKYSTMSDGGYYRFGQELKEFAKAPVMVQGGIRSVRKGGEIIRAGMSDMFSMARALMSDPEMVVKTAEGREDEISPCIDCGRCKYLRQPDLTLDCEATNGFHPISLEALRYRTDPATIPSVPPFPRHRDNSFSDHVLR